jgi:hypothetical protein
MGKLNGPSEAEGSFVITEPHQRQRRVHWSDRVQAQEICHIRPIFQPRPHVPEQLAEQPDCGDSDYVEAPRPFIYSAPVTSAPAGQPYTYQVEVIRSLGDLTRRDAAEPKPGARFWRIEPLKFSLTQKPTWMSINADTGLITGTSDGTGGKVLVSVTLTKEHRLVHDKENIVWGNEYEQSRTYESVGPVIQQFVVK